MKWFKRRTPTDPGADYIAQLNKEAEKRALEPAPYLPTFRSNTPMVHYGGDFPTAPGAGDLYFDANHKCYCYDAVTGCWKIVENRIHANSIHASRITANTIHTNLW